MKRERIRRRRRMLGEEREEEFWDPVRGKVQKPQRRGRQFQSCDLFVI